MEVDYKVGGGKLLRISAQLEKGTIKTVTITGDFFLHPEESIVEIERFLLGRKISGGLEKELVDFFEKNGITPIGFSARDLVEALLRLAGKE